MANVLHNALTGAELHEPKGVAAATAGKIYVADGSNSGDWTVDIQKQLVHLFIPGGLHASAVAVADMLNDFYIPIPYACTISTISYSADIRSSLLATYTNTITGYNNAGTAMTGGAKTIIGSDSGPKYGDLTVTANNTFTAGQVCKITRSVGNAYTRFYDWNIWLHLTRTGN